MIDPFELLLAVSADDGAAASTGDFPGRQRQDAHEVYNEWLREKGVSTEYGYLLDAAATLCAHVLRDQALTPRTEHQMRLLVQRIRDQRKSDARD